MARFGRDNRAAHSNAQANADATGERWVVFSDTSGAWNSERYRTNAPCHNAPDATIHEPIIDQSTGMSADERGYIG
jgi:hypothetical protein